MVAPWVRRMAPVLLIALAAITLSYQSGRGAEEESCKFGMVGTPPNNCECPTGTEFAGYKGCIPISCPTGAVVKGNGCVCSGGYVAVGNECRVIEPPKVQPPEPPKQQPKPKKQPKKVPTYEVVCTWNGTAPFCNGSCRGPGKFVRNTSSHIGKNRCLTGKKVECCQKVKIF